MYDLATADLARSGILPEEAQRAGIGVVDNARMVYIGFARVPALVLPYMDPRTRQPMTYGDGRVFNRVRYLADVHNDEGKLVRYSQPRDSGVHAYFAPVIDWAPILDNPAIPIVFTEGEKKALSACLHGVPTIGLGGVYNWRENNTLISELALIDWRGRQVIVCYDSDAVDNPQVRQAELALCAELQRRGADVRLARLEHTPDGKKQGMDDYIAAGRMDVLMKLLTSAEWVSTLELDVMALNAEIAYIEDQDCVYVPAENLKLSRSAFMMGSRFSALETSIVRTIKGKPVESKVKLAPLWLVHPGARRYAGTVFDPGTSANEVHTDRGILLNKWRGFTTEDGAVDEFVELTDYLFSRSEEGVQEIVMNLLAYKAQNPAIKIPLAVAMIGPQGCGKSMWARIVGNAFSPYYYAVPSKALKADFQPFIEDSLMVVIDEAQAVHVEGARDKLKNLISESKQELNKKHVSQVQITTYCQFILTSNDRRVGAFERDDRRHIVVDCPRKREDSFYDRLGKWEAAGGAARLIHYLLNLDLKGWQPPKMAPMTAEKHMSYMEALKPIEKVAEEMQSADYNVVAMWIDGALAWARVAELGNNAQDAAKAREITQVLGSAQVRPFYTPEELALMFPSIVAQLYGNKKMETTPSGEISRQLRNNGIPYLKCLDNPQGFRWRGRLAQFLIIADQDTWRNGITQAQFETEMARFPTYAQAQNLRNQRQRAS